MNTILHPAHTRGHANYGWLDTWHTFSFAHYFNPERMHFGALRVLNDDTVQGGKGFGRHPHDNMEIISIPLLGELEHADSMGNRTVIREHDVQIMSAGTGVEHSEYNKNADRPVSFLQIWVFPKKRNIAPRYDQRTFKPEERLNRWQQVVSPVQNDEGVWINQDAWFYRTQLQPGITLDYAINRTSNGIYLFVIDGSVQLDNLQLNRRDGVGITDADKISLTSNTSAELLLMEVPLTF
ncbi:MAG: pirin family protein [Cyclobacteriaceae bacterium]|nr:pirin family protein [Cyclobacteriaceae bacterium]